MALREPQYIFGDFSPDEFNQFFVTPRSSVELPPFDGVALDGPPATEDPPEGPESPEYQRPQPGHEVPERSATGPAPSCGICSTLNPQAPEFILSCATSRTSAEDGDKDVTSNPVDGQDPDTGLALDSPGGAEDEGPEGGLGQRERKRKKKRPPGYYSYLDGDQDAASPGALVNGHTGPDDAEMAVAGDSTPSPSPRTCRSPQEPADWRGGAGGPGGSFPGALEGRTAGQLERLPGAAPELTCLPAGGVPRTAGADTTEKLAVVNGQILESSGEALAANGLAFHTAESTDSEPAPARGPSAADGQGSVPGGQPKSWASLFHGAVPSALPVPTPDLKYSPPAVPAEKQVDAKEGLVPVSEDPVALEMAELLENVTLVHKPVSLQPRGLINKGNWCYINATLQALVACPPMYHLMKVIPLYSKVQRPCTSTPMIDSFVRLMNEFTNMPVPPKPRQALGDRTLREIRPGAAFEPTYIYRLLTVIKSSLSEKGRQEDAEEYLGFILNGLHEEMLALKKLLTPDSEKAAVSNGPGRRSAAEEPEEQGSEGSEDEWEQVGPRNRTAVTRQADFVQTPITGIFGGHIRSVVSQQSSKDSATLQPFFTLQLDIQSDRIHTVQDALESLAAREAVQGYTTKTRQEVEVSRRVTLEKLPPVLVLHLKRFVYEKSGGCQKLVKNIDYPVDLEISRELLSPGVKNKNLKCHRTYRLFAVVYHHGSSATGGHYTTDVFQIGLSGWLRIDDQTVRVVSQYQVVKPAAGRTAYLLYYRRADLL
ncbi:ubiquitin carboxyl-terminal hydrolase 10 [Sorex fumeus]|uniref:ubiquitin carboxyl-terminal hydrolase 10 n=1 Tax=Sorex fumeus TaxID=62283 RepID=UPI0024AD24A4|nr:ubiquitin carboxyl-terminal hydrolase 10 [Sorex fumeus]